MSLADLPRLEPDPLRVFIVGMSGSGKTSVIKQSLPDFPRILVWDWKHEYENFEVGSLRRTAELLVQPEPFRIAFRPSRTGSLKKQFLALSSLVLNFPRARDFVFIIDEAHLVVDATSDDSQGLSALLRLSRSQNIGLIYTSQRPTYVPGSLLGECHWLIVFHVHRRSDLLSLSHYLDDETLEQVPCLQKFEHFTVPLVMFS